MMPTLPFAREITERQDYRRNAGLAELSTQATPQSKEINRLLTAAVVNRRFCSLLLTDPIQAVTNGYNGETFALTAEEVQVIHTIKASTLRDFVLQLLKQGMPNQKPLVETQSPVWMNKVYARA